MRPVEPRNSPSVVPSHSKNASSNAGESTPPPPLPIPATPLSHNPPHPIGPEALKRIREAIQSGEYPSDAVVRSGLERLIRRPE